MTTEHKAKCGVTVYIVELKGKQFACVEELGLQISRPAYETEKLGPFDIEEFAAFARKDIAERVLKGE